jgi:flagellar basal-body rod modification protein FlgD
VNTNLDTLVAAQEQMKGLRAADLLGKDIKAPGNTVALRQGTPPLLQYALHADSASVTISILDNAGNLVRTMETPGQKAGEQSVSWDGKNAQGVSLPDGEYRFVVFAKDRTGNSVGAETFLQGRVEGVDYVAGHPALLVGGRRVELDALSGIRQAE